MPREMSARAMREMFATETDAVFLLLARIEHPDLDEPLLYVNNLEGVVSEGDVYVPFPFEIELPGQDPDNPGEARIRIDNIDREIVQTIRALESPPSVEFRVVLAEDPDVIEALFAGLVMRNTNYDALMVRAVLRFDDLISEPISVAMTPSRFPAMF